MLIANKIGDIKNNNKLIEKCGKLSKTRKLSKSQKLSKSKKLAKSEKKLLKSGNLPYFNAKENKPSFLISKAKTTFNCFWLVFIKAPSFHHFDLKYHILI